MLIILICLRYLIFPIIKLFLTTERKRDELELAIKKYVEKTDRVYEGIKSFL